MSARRPAFWDERDAGFGRRLALAPLGLLSLGYAAGARLHRAWWERGVAKRVRLPCKVVSVGNLVVGGSGKTPVAGWVAAALHRRGWPVAIASRGYGGEGADAVEVVSDGRRVLGRSERVGEEPMLLAGIARGVPVLVGRRRDVVGRRAIAAFNTGVLILDDGFQHHRLAKDVELVTLTRGGFGNGRVVPRGPLREPLGALSRADAVLVIDGPLHERDAAILGERAAGAARFALRRRPAATRPLAGGAPAPAAALAGQRVGMLCGIAQPDSFRRTLAELGAHVVAERTFPDHHRYRPRDLVGLAEEAPLWVTTEKDAGKILPRWVGDASFRVLALETVFPEGARFLDWLEERLHAHAGGRDARVPRAAPR